MVSGDGGGQFLPHLFCPITLTCFILMLTECSSSGSPDFIRNTLPVVISGGHMFLLIHRTLHAHIDGHFLLHLLAPITLTCLECICVLSYIVDMFITVMTFMSLCNMKSNYSLVISRPTCYSIK